MSFQLWILGYHIHHTILSVGLLVIAVIIWLVGHKKSNGIIKCLGFFLAGISIIAFLQWVCYTDECGGILWITKGI
ncbi:MAG: hypothetical protein HXS54_06155 [Theionarchaea archaeon]|nr:hypothetical protein [Theionarchaea archaeon]